MIRATEIFVPFPGREIKKAEVVEGGVKVYLKSINPSEEPEDWRNVFELVNVESLSSDDAFLKWDAKSPNQAMFKSNLLWFLKRGKVRNFYHAKIDPSIDEYENVVFKAGEEPAVKHRDWWVETLRTTEFRMGTREEYTAFLGYIMKQMYRTGWALDEIWEAICDDSSKIGHFIDSINPSDVFEKTGSRGVCGFCDLTNTKKLLTDSKGHIYTTGGQYVKPWYKYNGKDYPLADVFMAEASIIPYICGTAWLVVDEI